MTTSVAKGEAMQASVPGSSGDTKGFSKHGSWDVWLVSPVQSQASGRPVSASDGEAQTALSVAVTLRPVFSPSPPNGS